MLLVRLEEIEAALGSRPDDPALWHALAQACLRTGARPTLPFAAVAGALVRLLAAGPGTRGLAEFLAELHGASLVPAEESEPPPWFLERDRAARVDGIHWDRVTGLPLALFRRKDQARMVLVPEGETVRGVHGDPRLPLQRISLDSFYLDVDPVPARQMARFLAQRGDALPKDWARAGREGPGPAHRVPPRLADAYAAWVGTRLPTEAEWEKAVRGTEGWKFPWGMEDREGVERCPETRRSVFWVDGVRTDHLDLVADYWTEADWSDVRSRNPGRLDPPPRREQYPGWSRERYITAMVDEFENRHDEAPAGAAERVRASLEAETVRWPLMSIRYRVAREGSQRFPGGSRPCMFQTVVPQDELDPNHGYRLGFRLAFSPHLPSREFPPASGPRP